MSSYLTPDEATRWKRSNPGFVGAATIAAIVALFVVVVPLVEDNVDYGSSGRIAIDDYTTLALADGWKIETQSDFLFIFTDGTYQIVVPASAEDPSTAEESLVSSRDAYASDAANDIGAITSFTTDDGAPGASYEAVIATDPTGSRSLIAAISQNGRLLKPAVAGPLDAGDPIWEDIRAMIRSVVIAAEPQGGDA